MAEPMDKEKLTEEAIQLQKKLSDGDITDSEKTRLEEIKVQLKGGGKSEKVKFKVKSDADDEEKVEQKPAQSPKNQIVKEAKVIETPDIYERRSSYSIDDIKKKIDRLDSEGTGKLRDRYQEKYGEQLIVPDLHSDNVKEALEDVKPYLDVDDVDVEDEDEKIKAAEEDKGEDGDKEEEKDEGPGFFAKLIEKIKAFFKKLFSKRKNKKKDKSVVVDEAVVAASNGE